MKQITATKAYQAKYSWSPYTLYNNFVIRYKHSSNCIIFKVGKKEFSTLDEAKEYIDSK